MNLYTERQATCRVVHGEMLITLYCASGIKATFEIPFNDEEASRVGMIILRWTELGHIWRKEENNEDHRVSLVAARKDGEATDASSLASS